MRSRRCFISITRAKPGQWVPNAFGGRENLEAVYFLKRTNEVCYEQLPGHHDDRRGINRLARRVAADLSWRPRLRLQMEHGLDARLPALHGARSDLSAAFITTTSPSRSCTPSRSISSSSSATTKSSTARGRSSTRCRAMNGRSSRISGCFTPGCTGIRAKSCSSWAASSARGANGITIAGSIGSCCNLPRHDGLRRLVQHLNYVYKNEPALWELDDTYEGFEWIDFHDADNSVVAFLRRSRAGRGDRFCGQRDAGGASRLSPRACLARVSTARSSTPTRETYGGSNVGNMGGLRG